MKILVTGSNGLLGQKLVRLLDADAGIDLVATARKQLSISLGRGSFSILDITDKQDVIDCLQRHQPDIVINTAAMTQVDQCETDKEACWQANVTAVAYLVEACEKINAHLIHISTDFIFDGSHGPLTEEEPAKPVNYYGESKLAGEQVVKRSSIKWTIIRTVLVYGITSDLSRSNIVLWVKNSLENRKEINVVNDQWRTPTLAEDLAMGCYLAAKEKATGVYHASGEEMMTPYDIAVKTAQYFKLDTSLIHATDSTKFKQPAARPLTTGFDITKAKKQLGYKPHTFTEGLAILADQIQQLSSKK